MSETVIKGLNSVFAWYKKNEVIPDRNEEYDRILEESRHLAEEYDDDFVFDFIVLCLIHIEKHSMKTE